MSDHTYQKGRDRRLLPSQYRGRHSGRRRACSLKLHSNLNWFEVVETRGHISNGKVAHYQVVLKIGFRLDE